MIVWWTVFGRPFVKRFAQCYRTVVCLSVLSVCDVGVLWPNGWIDKDETWHGGSFGPGHIVLDGDTAPPNGHSPLFSAHVCCNQTAGWIKMPLGTEVGLGPGDRVRWGSGFPHGKGVHVYCGQTVADLSNCWALVSEVVYHNRISRYHYRSK